MESGGGTRTRSTCRLAVQGNTGRVRWLIGDERSWKNTLKILVGVPVVLVCALLIAIALPRAANVNRVQRSNRDLTHNYHSNEGLSRETKNDFINEIQTTYTPPINMPLKDNTSRMGRKVLGYKPEENASEYWVLMPLEQERSKTKRKANGNQQNSKAFLEHETLWKKKMCPADVRKLQAATMKKYMNTNVDPCTDFYSYACGNWEKYNFIPADRTGFDNFELLREGLDAAMKELLSDEANVMAEYSPDDARVKAKNLFKSCANEERLQQRGARPLQELLVELGGWPMINKDWDETQFDFIWLLGMLKRYNNDVLISEWVGPDVKNSDEYVIQLDQTTLGLPSRDYFLDKSNLKYLEAYRIYMVTIAHLMGADLFDATKEVSEIIHFETELAKIVENLGDRRGIAELYSRTTVQGLFYSFPQINWFRYFALILEAEVEPDEPVVTFCEDYIRKLVVLLSHTPQRTVANYLLWRFVRHRVNNLDYRFQQAKQRFYYILLGREKAPPQWQVCVSQVNSNLGMAVGSLFVQKYFDESSKSETLDIAIHLMNAFREIVSKLDWLDEETKKLARTKINAMSLKIGYPGFILHEVELSARYADIEIDPDLYFENMLSVLRHLTRVEHARLGTAVNRTLWNTAPVVVNAYYSRNRNQIMFPAGILQPPFYHKYFPKCLNYGGIGVVIGHEITHGFDDKGRLYDKDGNMHQWWHDNAITEFQERAQCLTDQYNAYVMPGLNEKINGENTQCENIADNGGIKHAFLAYKQWSTRHLHKDESMPGMNFTAEELFFLSFAQIWCGTSRPQALRNKLRSGAHAPGRFRVIGALSNFKEFSRVFKCPMGSPMNPEKKCNIW